MKNITANEKMPCVINDAENRCFPLIEILGGNPNLDFSIKEELPLPIQGSAFLKTHTVSYTHLTLPTNREV